MPRRLMAAAQGDAARELARQTREHVENARSAARSAEAARRAREQQPSKSNPRD